MNSRERYYAVTHYEPFDHCFQWEMGPYEETSKRWRREGMPADEHLAALAGYDRFEIAPVQTGMVPCFDYEDIEETQDYKVYRDSSGIRKKSRKDTPPPAMPQYLEYPVRTRQDWKEFVKRLDPDSPSRFPMWWDSIKKQYEGRDYPLGISAGSLFGTPRNWMGVEHITVMMYDDPAFVEEMMDVQCELFVRILKKVVLDVQFDFAQMWEDMAYKTASLISPRHFKEFMTPRYRKIVDVLHSAGIDIIMLDSDGNLEELIPLWLECGINFIYPMEVAAGMDVVRLRKKFGKDLRMGGGMDKRILASSKEAIKHMVDEKRTLIAEGGYIPGADHAIPPDVPWENYIYYRQLLNEAA